MPGLCSLLLRPSLPYCLWGNGSVLQLRAGSVKGILKNSLKSVSHGVMFILTAKPQGEQPFRCFWFNTLWHKPHALHVFWREVLSLDSLPKQTERALSLWFPGLNFGSVLCWGGEGEENGRRRRARSLFHPLYIKAKQSANPGISWSEGERAKLMCSVILPLLPRVGNRASSSSTVGAYFFGRCATN